jgi:hypothetical protein
MNKAAQRYNVYEVNSSDTVSTELLATMPMHVMREVFSLHKDGERRILFELDRNPICQVFFPRPIPGFGKAVIIEKA